MQQSAAFLPWHEDNGSIPNRALKSHMVRDCTSKVIIFARLLHHAGSCEKGRWVERWSTGHLIDECPGGEVVDVAGESKTAAEPQGLSNCRLHRAPRNLIWWPAHDVYSLRNAEQADVGHNMDLQSPYSCEDTRGRPITQQASTWVTNVEAKRQTRRIHFATQIS